MIALASCAAHTARQRAVSPAVKIGADQFARFTGWMLESKSCGRVDEFGVHPLPCTTISLVPYSFLPHVGRYRWRVAAELPTRDVRGWWRVVPNDDGVSGLVFLDDVAVMRFTVIDRTTIRLGGEAYHLTSHWSAGDPDSPEPNLGAPPVARLAQLTRAPWSHRPDRNDASKTIEQIRFYRDGTVRCTGFACDCSGSFSLTGDDVILEPTVATCGPRSLLRGDVLFLEHTEFVQTSRDEDH